MSNQVPDYPFDNLWSLFVKVPEAGFEKKKNVMWEDSFHKICDFNSLNQFWIALKNLPSPEQMRKSSNYSIFKDGIKPAWEDKRNVGGGRVQITVKNPSVKWNINQLFIDMMLCVMGHDIDFSTNINGLVFNPQKPVIEFWYDKYIQPASLLVSAISQAMDHSVSLGMKYKHEDYKLDQKPF
ncbi:putative translation initiation factor 4E [Blattamonas nauphoetae]|uniref:Translation initiation factor 4E n=1 Tax=Blattamonas nauphoetae TaxID=2049346 RepID=A0ABQ9Y4X6_9EUKA|nr:putative translation initiation factor 4E [Blattamonas nauphoetae]